MFQPMISVIVPVYKAEAYLEKCVNSIRNQTYENLEIILVDDGSPDRSGEICDALAKQDGRIRVFHKENGGQSSARNMGLDHMSGEYVTFVDSDDWIENDMYRHLYTLAVEKAAQIVCCGIQKDYLSGRTERFDPTFAGETQILEFSMLEALQESLNNTKITYSPCDKLYHSSIFDGLRMTEGKIYEDMEIIPKCIEKAQKVLYDPYPYYHYNLTDESTIRGEFNPRRFAEADVALEKAQDYKVRYPQFYVKAMCCYVGICLNIIHISAGVKSCEDRRKAMISEIQHNVPSDVVNALGKKDKLKFAALRISPAAYELLMRVYDRVRKGL